MNQFGLKRYEKVPKKLLIGARFLVELMFIDKKKNKHTHSEINSFFLLLRI